MTGSQRLATMSHSATGTSRADEPRTKPVHVCSLENDPMRARSAATTACASSRTASDGVLSSKCCRRTRTCRAVKQNESQFQVMGR